MSRPAIHKKAFALRLFLIFFTKSVSHPSDRFNQIRVQFSPQVHNMDIDGFFFPNEIIAPHFIEQIVPCKYPAWVEHEKFQKPVFRMGKGNGLSANRNREAFPIQPDISIGKCGCGFLAHPFFSPAQNRLQPHEHQLHGERFRDVIIHL